MSHSPAQDAADRAQAALSAGQYAEARRWIERARRLAPGDGAAALSLAMLLLRQRDAGAATLFEEVIRIADLREAWLGLAAARRLAGDHEAAAVAQAHALASHAVDASASGRRSLDIIARQSQAPGWCGLTSVGELLLSIAAPRPAAPLLVCLDGKKLRAVMALDVHGCGGMALPPRWLTARSLDVEWGGRPLLGSPIDIAQIRRIEGFVAGAEGGLSGWAWAPHDPEYVPVLTISDDSGAHPVSILAQDASVSVPHWRPLARPRGFQIGADRLKQLSGLLSVRGRDGRNLYGSPLDPAAWQRDTAAAAATLAQLFSSSAIASRPTAARAPIPMLAIPAAFAGPPASGRKRPRAVDVVIPVHDGRNLTLACLDTVLAGLPDWARIVVVDDASPDPALAIALDRLASSGSIRLLRHKTNRGFPGAANTGIRASQDRDVVLLNSDTLVPATWLERLRSAAYTATDIGTVTPLSNDATILSYPSTEHPNAVPDLAETRQLDAAAQAANAAGLIDIPTAVGFCAYIKRDCLDAVGLLREDVFAQGYGEENDFCMRARHLGWRHVAATGVFVAHVGGQSFGPAKRYLITCNLETLNLLHPGYAALVERFQDRDPLADARRRLDRERWQRSRTGAPSVLLITHSRQGGVRQRVFERARLMRAAGMRPIVLWPAARRGGGSDCILGDGPEGGTPNLRFAIPGELEDLAGLLRADQPLRAEIHHLLGHDHEILGLCQRLGIPYDIVVHDYAWFCPRITLVGSQGRYCGEPAVSGCIACIADNGSNTAEDIAVPALRQRSGAELAGARHVTVPSADVATRMRRHFPSIATRIEPWENDAGLPARPRTISKREATRRVCVIGAIGIEKGYEVLLACARDAADRRLAIEFVLIGYSCDDSRLLQTGRVFVTGAYDEAEVGSLIEAQAADFALLPSVWPETWSYTLTQAWQAGLDVVAFDIGTPADRIRQSGRGWLLPLGLPAPAINNRLAGLAPPPA